MRTARFDFWKTTLSLLVGVFLCAMAATFYIAGHRMSRVVDTDYYSHGLHYGRTASGASNPGIRWTLSPSLSGSNLKVCVSDASGAPICGGVLQFKSDLGTSASNGDRHLLTKEPGPSSATSGKGTSPLFSKERAPSSMILAESSPGVFTAPRPISPSGEVRGTLVYSRGEAVATQKLVLLQ